MKKGSFILGLGILGSFDGIVFHQLLQWHSVMAHTDLHGRIFSDGLFHSLTVVFLVWGAIWLWMAGNPNEMWRGKRTLLGGILLGGGTFNLVEGIINHHLLEIHHVKMGDPHEFLYDVAFLAVGVLLIAVGWMVQRDVQDHSTGKAM